MKMGMVDEFSVGFRVQREWSWLILFAFFLGGMGAGLFLISYFIGFNIGLVVGLLIVAVGKNTAHLLFLGRPERFWRAFTQPFISWISRGIYFDTIFIIFSAL